MYISLASTKKWITYRIFWQFSFHHVLSSNLCVWWRHVPVCDLQLAFWDLLEIFNRVVRNQLLYLHSTPHLHYTHIILFTFNVYTVFWSCLHWWDLQDGHVTTTICSVSNVWERETFNTYVIPAPGSAVIWLVTNTATLYSVKSKTEILWSDKGWVIYLVFLFSFNKWICLSCL